MNDIQLIYFLTIAPVPILLAITLHEVSHGLVARRLGDTTAESQGRLTLNPLKHIDPIGTVVVPILLLATTGFLFGWARPVPVDQRNFSDPMRHMAYVAAAGPLSNLAMAVFWTLMMALSMHLLDQTWIGQPLALMADVGIKINLILMVLNLLPVPPLDGGRVVAGMLKPRLAVKFARIEPYGIWILLILLIAGVLGKVLLPVMGLFERMLYAIFGL